MKKFILLFLVSILALGAFAQKPKHDTTYVPVVLMQKTDTVKNLQIYYVDSTTGIVHRTKGYELVSGLYSENLHRYVKVVDGDIYYLVGAAYCKLDKDYLFTVSNPTAQAPAPQPPAPTKPTPPAQKLKIVSKPATPATTN